MIGYACRGMCSTRKKKPPVILPMSAMPKKGIIAKTAYLLVLKSIASKKIDCAVTHVPKMILLP